jgi:hypothetical protein
LRQRGKKPDPFRGKRVPEKKRRNDAVRGLSLPIFRDAI